jgi:hypothetical protein
VAGRRADLSAVGLGHRPDDRQAETDTLGAEAVKGLEELGYLVGRDHRTGVGNLQHRFAMRAGVRSYPDPAVLHHVVPHGVGEQVLHQPFQQGGVAGGGRLARLDVDRCRALGLFGRDVRDDVGEVDEVPNLQALGYSGFTVDEVYTRATATAVSKWQKALGLTETGTVELGRVVYASGAVRVDGHKAASGDPVGPGQPVLTYTGSAQVITVELAYDDRPLTKTGSVVTVTLPNGRSAPAKVTGSVVVINPAAGAEEEDTTIIEVTVGVDDPAVLAGHEQTTLDVAFVVAERDNVLTVPVAALLALAEGGYGVELVEGDSTRTVPVTTGLFAGGRVEVTGDGVTEGATVGMPS